MGPTWPPVCFATIRGPDAREGGGDASGGVGFFGALAYYGCFHFPQIFQYSSSVKCVHI